MAVCVGDWSVMWLHVGGAGTEEIAMVTTTTTTMVMTTTTTITVMVSIIKKR